MVRQGCGGAALSLACLVAATLQGSLAMELNALKIATKSEIAVTTVD
jgi:hypothetical protein